MIETTKLDRRSLLQNATAATAAAAGLLILKPELVRGSQRNSAVRLALLGCGNRGTEVARGFVQNADTPVVALGDLYEDALAAGRQLLNRTLRGKSMPPIGEGSLVKGVKAYQELAERKDVDAVYVATPAFLHPRHLEAVLQAGKHVYLEKPVAVDVPGVNRVAKLGQQYAGKASLAVGFQIRHASPYVQMVERIHKGALGEMVNGELYYLAGANQRPDYPGLAAAEKRLRNWIHDKTLSGDILVEQNIHLIDWTNWVMRGHPEKAMATGGGKGRANAGDCYSHYHCLFTYPGDVHVSLTSAQFLKGMWEAGVKYFGTRGNAEAKYDAPVKITGENAWEFPGLAAPGPADAKAAAKGSFRGALDDADPNKQRAFIASIRDGQFLNEAAAGCESALSAMMGRKAAYLRREVTWTEITADTEESDPGPEIKRLLGL